MTFIITTVEKNVLVTVWGAANDIESNQSNR